MTIRLDPVAPGTGPRPGVVSRTFPVAVGLAGLAAGTLLYSVDPYEGGYPTCPMLATTGLYCPGCGSLRAVHDLLHGDLAGALARNPLAVLAVPYLAVWLVSWALRASGRPAPRSTALPAWLIWTLLGVVIVYAVARNVPGWTGLSPA